MSCVRRLGTRNAIQLLTEWLLIDLSNRGIHVRVARINSADFAKWNILKYLLNQENGLCPWPEENNKSYKCPQDKRDEQSGPDACHQKLSTKSPEQKSVIQYTHISHSCQCIVEAETESLLFTLFLHFLCFFSTNFVKCFRVAGSQVNYCRLTDRLPFDKI